MSATAAAVLLARFFGLRRRHAGEEVDLGPVGETRLTGRLWRADRPAPPIVLAAGITPRGTADPRLARLATALAATPRLVFAPDLALAEQRLDPADVARLRAAVHALAEHPRAAGRVTLLGFSFGGSYALVAASDPAVARRVGVVAAFGAYAQLRELLPKMRRLRARSIRERLEAALADGDAAALSSDEHAALTAVLLEDAAVETLPSALRGRLDALSPVEAGPIRTAISLVHAVDDPVIPHGELDALAAAFPHARTYAVRLFTHVDFRPTPRRVGRAVSDLVSLWRFARDVIAGGATSRGRAARR